MLDYAVVFFLFVLACCVWVLICNSRTYTQRGRLISRWPRGDAFGAHVKDFDRVSYDAHLWRLVTFRDPRALYGDLNRELF